MCAMVSRVGPEARITPSSMYNVVGESVTFSSFTRVLSPLDVSIHLFVLQYTSPIIWEVKYAARIGKMHDPWGTLVSIGQSMSLLPSRQREAH